MLNKRSAERCFYFGSSFSISNGHLGFVAFWVNRENCPRVSGFMGEFIGFCAIVIVVLLPLLRRLYIERFWVHGRGIVKRLDGSISTIPGAAGSWVWVPIIEYHAAKQTFSGRVSYWQRFNAKSKYSVGDEIEIIYDPRAPSRFILDSWIEHFVLTIFIAGVLATGLHNAR